LLACGALVLVLGVTAGLVWCGGGGGAAVVKHQNDAGIRDAAVPARDAGRGPIPSGGERLAGRVIDQSSSAVAGAHVVVRLDPPRAPGVKPAASAAIEVDTDALGAFEVKGLAPGRYRLLVEGAAVVPAEVRQIDVPGPEVTVMVARRVLLEGVVTDAGKPVAGATVEVASASLDVPRLVETGPDGHFLVDDVPEGRYAVLARRGARAAAATGVERFGLGPWSPLDLALGPAAVVEGRVIDAGTRVPVVGAHVALLPEDGPARTAATGADGTFRVEGVLPGTWSVDVVALGYLPPRRDGLEIAAEQTLALELPLTRGAVIEGRVVDARGAPVAGAHIDVAGEGKGGVGSVRVTAGGRARRVARALGAVPGTAAPGLVDAAAPRPGFIPMGELGVTTGPVPFAPPRGVRVGVKPTDGDDDEDAEPPVSAEALAQAEQGLVSDVDGRFRVDALPAGKYRVRAFHVDFAGGESTAVELGEGELERDVTVVVTRGASLAGRVLDAGGSPKPLARVVGYRGDVRVASTSADEDGHYRLDHLGGTVRVVASAPGAADGEVSVAFTAADEGKVIGKDLRLGALGDRTAGRVEDPQGRGLASARVAAVIGGETRATATTDADGRFELGGLPAGKVELRVTSDGYPEARVPGVRVGDDRVRLTVPAGGGIEGLVRDAHTRGRLADFQVRGEGPGGQVVARAGKAGELELSPLAPGKWTLTFTARGHAKKVVVVDVPAGRGPRAITVSDLRVDLAQGAILGGTVYDRHGEAVAGASVEGGGARATTDRTGRYKLVDVAPGEVTVKAHDARGEGEKTIRVRSGDELLSVDVRLR
jgi:protocatechuate 3,4-dioxygenase beta subunit